MIDCSSPEITEAYTGELTSFCVFPQKPIEILIDYARSEGKELSRDDVINALTKDYARAIKDESASIGDYKILFKTNLGNDELKDIEITLHRSDTTSLKMYVYWVNTPIITESSIDPVRLFEQSVFLGSWATFLTSLADKAYAEDWNGSQGREFARLQQYIRYTFFKIMQEDKLVVSKDGDFAAFNTGLADEHYCDIFVCLQPNSCTDTIWRCMGVCVAGEGVLGDMLLTKLNKLPESATFFESGSELFLPADATINVNYEHIIMDNLYRFSPDCLKQHFYGNWDAWDVIDRLSTCEIADRNRICDCLRDILKSEPKVYMQLKNSLSFALDHAMKQLKRNPRLAVPIYHPRENCISLLLPLYMSNMAVPDLALVLSKCKTKSNTYQGQTAITLEQAYTDARLLGVVDSLWLSTIR